MNPSEYYKRLIASITEDDVRRVAEVMAEHIGEENRITLQNLVALTKLNERTVRVILNTLVIEYGIPIGAQSGRAGRWICANKRELDTVIADLESRANETRNRVNALRVATIPNTLYEDGIERDDVNGLKVERKQPFLFDPPKLEPWQLQYGGFR